MTFLDKASGVVTAAFAGAMAFSQPAAAHPDIQPQPVALQQQDCYQPSDPPSNLGLIPRPAGGPRTVTGQVDPAIAASFQQAIKAQPGDNSKVYSIAESKGKLYGMSANTRWDDSKTFAKKDEIWKYDNNQWKPMFRANMVTDADDEATALDAKFAKNGMSPTMRNVLMYGEEAPIQ